MTLHDISVLDHAFAGKTVTYNHVVALRAFARTVTGEYRNVLQSMSDHFAIYHVDQQVKEIKPEFDWLGSWSVTVELASGTFHIWLLNCKQPWSQPKANARVKYDRFREFVRQSDQLTTDEALVLIHKTNR